MFNIRKLFDRIEKARESENPNRADRLHLILLVIGIIIIGVPVSIGFLILWIIFRIILPMVYIMLGVFILDIILYAIYGKFILLNGFNYVMDKYKLD